MLRMFSVMTVAKQCDEFFRGLLMSGQLQMMWFSSRGQEVVGAATGLALRPDDYLVTYYRGLPEQLAKGMSLRDLWAEWLGKDAGLCGGRAGPIHTVDPAHGVMVNTGIIGGGMPIAGGLALSSKIKGDGRVTLCSFGDGQTNIGGFHEALNLASVWQLPVVFLCVNNGYAETTKFSALTAIDHVSERAAAYRMPGVTVDGNDPLAMYEAARVAVDRARAGGGPTLLEAVTYRLAGHYSGDSMAYMPKEELAAAIAADPVPAFRSWLIEGGHASDDELGGLEKQAQIDIEDAYEYALGCPDPDPAQLTRDIVGVPA